MVHSRMLSTMYQPHLLPYKVVFQAIFGIVLTVVLEFFHNSRLFKRIEQEKITQKFGDLTKNLTQINCLAVRHLNHYTRMISVLVLGYN